MHDGVPLDLFEAHRAVETRADATTPAPATGQGSTLAPIQPFVFAQSIAPRLDITMPQVQSGSYSQATITTAATAAAKNKGDKQESTAAALTPVTATRDGSRATARSGGSRSRRSGSGPSTAVSPTDAADTTHCCAGCSASGCASPTTR